jgi:hypothetical protein
LWKQRDLLKRLLKILRNTLLSVIALLLLLIVLVNFSPVQNYLARKAAHTLAQQLKTKVSIDRVRIDFLNHVLIQGLYIEDQSKDTLAYIGEAQVRITDWFIFKKQVPVLQYVGLRNAYIHLYRKPTSNQWNYDFIADAFSSPAPTKSNKPSQGFDLDLKKIDLDNVRFHMDDAWGGYDYDIDVGSFQTNMDKLDLRKHIAQINNLALTKASIRIRDFIGGKPPSPRKARVIDTTPFNTDNWQVAINTVKFDQCHFLFRSKDEAPAPNEFDPEVIEVSALSFDVRRLHIDKDTLRGKLEHFTAQERSGIKIKEWHSVVSVSPVASICDSMYLETNNSKLYDYYAMHYERFPDFEDYIAKVRMDARLNNAIVSSLDVAYFAPQLRRLLPQMTVKVTGHGHGTVDKLAAEGLKVSDGFSTAEGNIRITGLPDVDRTLFQYEGDIFTTGTAMLKYAPSLKQDPNVNLASLYYTFFSGSFNGYISDFNAKGSLRTNLGNAVADIRMKMPAKQTPAYSGTLALSGFDIGKLVNQPLVGAATLKASLQGASFDIDGIHINATTDVEAITLNGYTYRDIAAEGIWEHKKFTGKMLVNDSNLSLGFYGYIDVSGKDLKFNATANVLKCDLQKINLAAEPTLLIADFDLNCSGKTIDDFIGTAKLYNINLLRRNEKLDLDSIVVNSYFNEKGKHIDIESNLLSAQVNGQYRLSEMPNSIQYFLSRYLPNYIKSTGKVAADQDIAFNVDTREISNMLKVFTVLSGFDNSHFSGTLNTTKQSLTLNAQVPYGQISMVQLNDATLKGEGNLNQLALNGTVASVVVGDKLLNSSAAINATIGGDSLRYNIATKSDDQYGTVMLNGMAYAHSDSIYVHMAPSELYLNNVKWEIPAGSEIIYSTDYLYINNLYLNSSLQQLAITTAREDKGTLIKVHSTNIDLAQVGNVAGIAAYRPDGRLNGDIYVKDIFRNWSVVSDLKATDVKIGNDTIGTIVIAGDYSSNKKLVSLLPESGIFNDKYTLKANGRLSFDKHSGSKLEGLIAIQDVPLKILSPFLDGYASKLNGTVNGNISLGGTVDNPETAGDLQLKNIGARVDYIGTYYTIPTGTIKIKNQKATLDDITLYDAYQNTATATGSVNFADLQNIQMNIQLKTPQLEVVNLREYENDLFYGHVIANTQFSVSGTISNMRMSIKVEPTDKSHLFIPYNAAGDFSTNTYMSFKTYGKEQQQFVVKKKNKLSVNITATLNTLADVTFVLDPSSGDQINATGEGTLSMSIPANDDYSIRGSYRIQKGDYTFTFRQILVRQFLISSGSSITFNGALANTKLDINAIYPGKARLYDLLNANEAAAMKDPKEIEDAKTLQGVNVMLTMSNTLAEPDFKYRIEMAEKRSSTSVAYAKLMRINESDKSELFNQVGALLLLGAFIPPEGISSSMVMSSTKTALGDKIASSASPILTKALNSVLKDKNLSVQLQYNSYSLTDNTGGTAAASDNVSRNVLKVGLKKSYFNDRLSVQIGSAYDWGRPTATTSSSSSNFNLAGDFRAQYLLTADGGVSLTGFRNSNYDVTVNDNVSRTGVGITFRKSFDNLFEFFHSRKRVQERQNQQKTNKKPPSVLIPAQD